jgi:hypothetical protein
MFAPVENADNANPGKPAFGLLRDDGSYTLTTYEADDGAVVGEHWVTLVNLARREQSARTKGDRRSFDVSLFTRISVPRRVTVVPGQENQIDIALTRQEVAKFGVVEDE